MRFFIIFSLVTAFAARWNQKNQPENFLFRQFQQAPVTNLSSLPTNGRSRNKCWTDDYYATIYRGVAVAWQGDFQLPKRRHPSERLNEYRQRVQVLQAANKNVEALLNFKPEWFSRLTLANRSKLPPAMKLDILNGRTDYPLFRLELNRTAQVAAQYKTYLEGYNAAKKARNTRRMAEFKKKMNSVNWFGICHGWAPATIYENEPQRCNMNVGGTKLPFESSDTKALLSLLYAQHAGKSQLQGFCGERCNANFDDKNVTPQKLRDSTFTDINPGAFHILLGNRLGLQQQGFIIDQTTDGPVWNQGIIDFKVKNLQEVSAAQAESFNVNKSDRPARGTVKQMAVTTDVTFIVEMAPQAQAHGLTNKKATKTKTYQYLLELNQNNEIIGGRWAKNSIVDHPDFAWEVTRPEATNPAAAPYFGEAMNSLLRESKTR